MLIKYTLKSLATLADLGCFIWALDTVATLCNDPYSPMVIGGVDYGTLVRCDRRWVYLSHLARRDYPVHPLITPSYSKRSRREVRSTPCD